MKNKKFLKTKVNDWMCCRFLWTGDLTFCKAGQLLFQGIAYISHRHTILIGMLRCLLYHMSTQSPSWRHWFCSGIWFCRPLAKDRAPIHCRSMLPRFFDWNLKYKEKINTWYKILKKINIYLYMFFLTENIVNTFVFFSIKNTSLVHL